MKSGEATLSAEETRALKNWLREIVPDGMSQSALARALGVERRTVVNLLSESTGFGYGITMLQFLQLAGVLVDSPIENPLDRRLAELEAKVELQGKAMTRALNALARDVRALAHQPEDSARPASEAGPR